MNLSVSQSPSTYEWNGRDDWLIDNQNYTQKENAWVVSSARIIQYAFSLSPIRLEEASRGLVVGYFVVHWQDRGVGYCSNEHTFQTVSCRIQLQLTNCVFLHPRGRKLSNCSSKISGFDKFNSFFLDGQIWTDREFSIIFLIILVR